MKAIAILLVLVTLAGMFACISSEQAALSEETDIPCTCGSPDALFDGCANSLCMSGQNNPDNADCACGDLTIGPTGGH